MRIARSTQSFVLPAFYSTLISILSVVSPASVQSQTSAQDSAAITAPISTTPVIAPPSNVVAADLANDDGSAIYVRWELSPDDTGAHSQVAGYDVLRSTSPDGPFEKIGNAVSKADAVTDNRAIMGQAYFYRVIAFAMLADAAGNAQRLESVAATAGPAMSAAQWFNTSRWFVLFMVLLVGGAIIYYIKQAQSGKQLYVRKIAGIDAVDEAIGRATEMGKKVYFVPGIQDMNDVQTIAGIAILGRVAAVAAQYETALEVPVSRSMVMVTARETMKEAYTKVGRPDSFNDSQVSFITEEQFAYAAAIDGMIVREKPAAIFYMGAFFAESLILSETGNAAGAIQIAGTGEPTQLPFFVAACDYTLLGEELFAASAYLSREPRQLGSLKGQDFGKLVFLVAIIGGALAATFGWSYISELFKVG